MALFNPKHRRHVGDPAVRAAALRPWWDGGPMPGPHPFDDVVVDAELLEPEGWGSDDRSTTGGWTVDQLAELPELEVVERRSGIVGQPTS